MANIQVARSRNLRVWSRLPDALPVKPRWAAHTQDFWAPHVSRHDGRYYLYFSAKPDAALTDPAQGLCLGVATADRPEGPFADSGAPLQCGPGFVNIDPMAFDDPATGKRLLYWGSGFSPIKVQELAPEPHVVRRRQHARRSHSHRSARRPGQLPAARRGAPGSSATAHGIICSIRATIAVARRRITPRSSHARAQRPGRSRRCRPAQRGVVLQADARWLAPGHNATIEDGAGRTWIAYHAIDRKRPRTNPRTGSIRAA